MKVPSSNNIFYNPIHHSTGNPLFTKDTQESAISASPLKNHFDFLSAKHAFKLFSCSYCPLCCDPLSGWDFTQQPYVSSTRLVISTSFTVRLNPMADMKYSLQIIGLALRITDNIFRSISCAETIRCRLVRRACDPAPEERTR